MIAFFCRRWAEAHLLGGMLSSATREVDGPFRLMKGRLGGAEARVIATGEGADAAYSAARIAARRGSTSFIHFAEVLSTRSIAEKSGFTLCNPFAVSRIEDLAGLSPLQQLLPASATEMPMDLDALLPIDPIWSDGLDGFAIGTTQHWPDNRRLLRLLHEKRGIVGVDREAAGIAAASVECCASLKTVAMATVLLSPDGPIRAPELFAGRAFEEAARAVIDAALASIG